MALNEYHSRFTVIFIAFCGCWVYFDVFCWISFSLYNHCPTILDPNYGWIEKKFFFYEHTLLADFFVKLIYVDSSIDIFPHFWIEIVITVMGLEFEAASLPAFFNNLFLPEAKAKLCCSKAGLSSSSYLALLMRTIVLRNAICSTNFSTIIDL